MGTFPSDQHGGLIPMTLHDFITLMILPLWLTHFIEILLAPGFQLTKFIVGMFSYKARFRPQISSND